MQTISHVHFFFPHKAVPQIHESCIIFITQLLHHSVDCHPHRIPVSLVPVSKHCKLTDKMMCAPFDCFVFFSRFLYFSTIAVVPTLSALFVPIWISTDPPLPLLMIYSTLFVTCSILVPGKRTIKSSSLFSLVSVFLTTESPK